MYERENAFYEANKAHLREKYLGKELVIVGEEIIGIYDDLDSAVDETEKTRPLGTLCVSLSRSIRPGKIGKFSLFWHLRET
jgi:hypothetical protein